MRTTDATREPGPRRSGGSRSEAGPRSEASATGTLSRPGEPRARKPLALCSQPELVERARAGDRGALDQIFAECKPAISAAVATQENWLKRLRFRIYGDLHQEGRLAVLEALHNYQAERARGKFKHYADYYIEKYVRVAAITLVRAESVSLHLIYEVSNAFNQDGLEGEGDCLPDSTARASGDRASGDGSLSRAAQTPLFSDSDVAGEGGGREAEDAGGFRQSGRRASIREYLARPLAHSLEDTIPVAHGDARRKERGLAERLADEGEPDPGRLCDESHAGADDASLIPAEALHAAIGDLDESERFAVVGRYGLGTEDEMGIKELALTLAISESALKDLLSRAKAKLAMALAVEMVADEFNAGLFEEGADRGLARSA